MKKPLPPPIAPVRGRLFRVRAAAQYLGLGEWQVRLLLARGDLVALRSSGGRLMGIYETDCDAWMATHRRVAAPATPPPSGDERIAHLLPTARRFN